ncbi:unnamed protein product [Orchesella dallaii]|uniref:Uncharacterized protein n=1 Tax=Orchesella dallaii TaxID=48710 RepID=A0ABP1S463_9HEXA
MTRKQTVVAQAKEFMSRLAIAKPAITRMWGEEYIEANFLLNKFKQAEKVDRKELDKFCNKNLLQRARVHVRFFDLIKLYVPLQVKLGEAFVTLENAEEAMIKFIQIHHDDKWATLPRKDVLELTKLFKNDHRIKKFLELNVDDLVKQWDEGNFVTKLVACSAYMNYLKTDEANNEKLFD